MLRRLAQTNNAAAESPRARPSASPFPTTPTRPPLPTTPRTRVVYTHSPVSSPSLSASVPFDWVAARSRRPAPYATPLSKRVNALRNGEAGTPGRATPTKRVVRKKSAIERIKSIPSTIAFEISQFPNNIPLPAPKTSAKLLGGSMHFIHLCVRVSQIRDVPDSDLGWEDMYREGEGNGWWDMTVPLTCLLFAASLLNALYLFTRTKMYHLNMAKEPVSSPHAAFVSRSQSPRLPSAEAARSRRTIWSLLLLVLSTVWHAFTISLGFLLNLSPPKTRQQELSSRSERVQQLEVWTPGELEMALFGIYSPVHAWLWMATTSANWMLMSLIMIVVGAQLHALTRSYEALLKDRAIIAAEVMHEYDEKFVYPRVNPIRKDASVMTHEAEMVNWDEE